MEFESDKVTSAYLRLQAEGKRQSAKLVRNCCGCGPFSRSATESERCRPRITRNGEPAVVPTAKTRIPMGPHRPWHGSPMETNERTRCIAGSL